MLKHQLADYLRYAELAIRTCQWTAAMQELRHAMAVANKMKHKHLKSLIFRAMNHVRSARLITK